MLVRFKAVRQRSLSIVAAVLVALVSGLPSQSNAASPEQRCGELGTACICSEPLNTTTYTLVSGSNYLYNPADSTTKECQMENARSAVLARPAGGFFGTNSSSILSSLPAGHSVNHVLHSGNGATGIYDVGSWFPSGTPTARRAFRYYVYFSPNFEMSQGSSTCLNSGKMLKFSNQGPTMSYNGRWNLYAWSEWNLGSYDCCGTGPGGDSGALTALTIGNIRGKWHRLEAIATNIGGTPTRLQIFWKNVTDNGPEYKVVDTFIPTPQNGFGQDWTNTQATTLTRAPFGDSHIEWFRNGTCAGHFAASHIMYAAWSTDAGQRIGPAREIEAGAGSGDQVPPAAPGSPTIR